MVADNSASRALLLAWDVRSDREEPCEAYEEALRCADYDPITLVIAPASAFCYAEGYHQQYLYKVPNAY